ncbi:carbon-nitrogen family hydrolase [Streptomyces anulatus]|uniref:carbon-nitrogen family hydrolase n=1 Tax=Streptomyces anulatus TaxID=1892 RepID=UPI001C256571|nr:carbon-nitrogen family hydrolase [Streptomyces anulatus]
MRASLIQIAVDPDESVEDRRARAASLVVAQRGADLVVLPELWPVGAFAYTAFEAEAEPLEGPTHEVMAKAAAEAGTWLHAGSFVERAADGTLYNTSLVFSPQGERTAVYRKIHRFGFDQGEAVMMGAGEELVTVALPDTTLGLATCYDLRFPEQFRGLVDAGAEALVVVAGWPERRRSHWTLLTQARAVENQSYVLAVGTAGTHGDIQQAGHSIVVDPWGEVLARAGADEEVLTVELDADKVRATREQFPALKDRRLGLAPPL